MYCLGIVLAGGLSSRMGTNKAFLTLNNQTMLDRSANLLRLSGVDKVVISGENSGGESDLVHQGGPLAGIYSLIKKYRPQSILAVPVDMPILNDKHLSELRIKGQLSLRSAFFNDSPLPLFLPVNAFVEDYLNNAFTSPDFLKTGKGPSFKRILKMTNALSLPIEAKALVNTNTPQEWQQIKQLFNS